MSDQAKSEPKITIPYNEDTILIYETLARIARRIIQEKVSSKNGVA